MLKKLTNCVMSAVLCLVSPESCPSCQNTIQPFLIKHIFQIEMINLLLRKLITNSEFITKYAVTSFSLKDLRDHYQASRIEIRFSR